MTYQRKGRKVNNTFILLGFMLFASISQAEPDDHQQDGHLAHDHASIDEHHNAERLFAEALNKNKTLPKQVIQAFQQKCQACHNGLLKNELAPPIVSVQQVYLKLSKGSKGRAKQRMALFLKNPSADKALMKPAVKLFGVMPNLGLNDQEIINFTTLILDSQFIIPEWFGEHFKSHDLKAPTSKEQ